jgi:hypothetical protein
MQAGLVSPIMSPDPPLGIGHDLESPVHGLGGVRSRNAQHQSYQPVVGTSDLDRVRPSL